MKMSQIVKSVTPMIAAIAKTGPMMPLRWSCPAARRTRIQKPSRRLTIARPPSSVRIIPRNAMKIAALTESKWYWTWAPIHSHAMGIGPQNVAATTTMSSVIASATPSSMIRRRTVPCSGTAR